MTMTLAVSDLWVSYRGVPAVRGVGVTVDSGEVVGVVGPNGAGKSTMMKTIGGLIAADKGTISLDGTRINGRPPEVVARQGVSLVPEGRHVFSRLTVRENLELGTVMRRGGKLDWDEILGHFPFLRERMGTLAGKLSGGEQQQLVIARALLTRPRVLLLDEPSLGLAPKIVDLIYEILGSLKRAGMTLLIVEQSLNRVLDVADRVCVMRTGQVVMSGSSSELRESAGFQEEYFGFQRGAVK